MDAPRGSSKLMATNDAKALALVDLLRRELGLPENVQWFEVRFEVDQFVLVTCAYHPVAPAETDPAKRTK